jgi:hypothetical protein
MYLYAYAFKCIVLYFPVAMDRLHKQFSNEQRHILLFVRCLMMVKMTETCCVVTFQQTSIIENKKL